MRKEDIDCHVRILTNKEYKYQGHFTYLKGSVNFLSDCRETVAYIKDFMTPYISFIPKLSNRPLTTVYHCQISNLSFTENLFDSSDLVVVHDAQNPKLITYGHQVKVRQCCFIKNLKSRTTACVDNFNRKIVVIEMPRESLTFQEMCADTYRIIRAILTKHAERKGAVLVHSGALARNKEVILICGGKNAGKTTLLFEMAFEWFRQYIGNDIVLLQEDTSDDSDDITVIGWPHSVLVGTGTLSRFPKLLSTVSNKLAKEVPNSSLNREPSEKILFSPSEITENLGMTKLKQGILRSIIFPKLRLSSPDSSFGRILDKNRLRNKLLSAILSPYNRSVWMQLFSVNNSVMDNTLTKIVNQIIERIPCYSFYLGKQANVALGYLVDSIWSHYA